MRSVPIQISTTSFGGCCGISTTRTSCQCSLAVSMAPSATAFTCLRSSSSEYRSVLPSCRLSSCHHQSSVSTTTTTTSIKESQQFQANVSTLQLNSSQSHPNRIPTSSFSFFEFFCSALIRLAFGGGGGVPLATKTSTITSPKSPYSIRTQSTPILLLSVIILINSLTTTSAIVATFSVDASTVDHIISEDKYYELSKEVKYTTSYEQDLLQADQSPKTAKSSSSANSIVVVSGQKATLTCPLLSGSGAGSSNKLLPSSSSSTSMKVLIKWQKESTPLPYDHRHHIQSNGTLIISSAQKRLDEGSYFCSFKIPQEELSASNLITSHESGSDNLKNSAIIMLRVIDPPRVGPYEFPADLQVGMKARAMCAVMQGDSPFRFAWTQDGRRIESDVPTSDSGALFRTQHFRDYSLLTVDSLTLAHAGNITCVVSNDASKTSQSAMLKINAPPQWLVEPRDSSVVLHQSVRIDCLASGSPKPFTTWKRATGGSPWEYIPIYNSVHYYLHPNGSMSIMAATQTQAGPYICQSTNGYGSDIGKLIHIRVNEPPRFNVQSQSQSAHKDKPVRLLCQPEGDRPIRMEWSLLNGTLLNELLLGRDNHRQAKLPVSDDDESSAFPFDIKEIPLELLKEETNNIERGGASETPNTPNELKSASAENSNTVVSVLTIHQPKREDSRVYVCKANNEFGTAELKIRLLVKENPDVPEDFSILNVTESAGEIRWREPFNGNSNIISYLVEYRLVEIDSAGLSVTSSASNPPTASMSSITSATIPIDRITVNGSLRSTMVGGFRSNTVYNIRIAAQNQIGQGDFTTWIRLRTEQSAPESPPLDVAATPTGPNSVKITWKSPKKSSWNGDISGYYIGYRAENSDTDLYKTVENGEENSNGKHESHITNLHRSTVYEAWVQAFNARGTGPRSELVLVRTLADVPPSAPLLRLHTSTTDSITISWSPAAFGSRSSNDLTLYYRLYQPATGDHSTVNGGTILRTNANSLAPNTWRDISILEPSGRHTVTGLECGRAYEFFATAHNSVGKSEPSTPLVARTRGDAPLPPPRDNLLSEIGAYGAIINLHNWKNNDCKISHFSMRIRNKPLTGPPQAWSVLAMHHNPMDNYVLRKLNPNTAYEIEVTAHSSAGSTQVIHQFITPNATSNGETFFNKIGFDSKVSAAYPMPSSTSEISFSDYEILLPVISSLIVVVVIVAVACFLCSRDHHSLFLQPGLHGRQRQQSSSSENKVPFQHQEMSILKELARSSSVTIADSHVESVMTATGMHHSDDYSCLNGMNGEPPSLTNSDLLNHHHLRNSPHHNNVNNNQNGNPNNNNNNQPTKNDMVELQSFYHHHQNSQSQPFYHHHAHQMPQQSVDNTGTLKPQRAPSSGNYALPYDILPVNRDSSNVAIYGQRTAAPPPPTSQQQSTANSQPLVEPLYATTKPIANYNHFCSKLDDSQLSDSIANRSIISNSNNNSNNSNNSSSNSSSRANYESLVQIICPEPRR